MKIRITETKVYEYVPDLNDEFYSSEEISTTELAYEADYKWCVGKKGDASELGSEKPSREKSVWQLIIDDEIIDERVEYDNDYGN